MSKDIWKEREWTLSKMMRGLQGHHSLQELSSGDIRYIMIAVRRNETSNVRF